MEEKTFILKNLFQSNKATAFFSSAIRPIIYLLTFFISILTVNSIWGKSNLVIYTMLSIIIFLIALFTFAYIYFMIKNPAFLRTENYLIKKQAIDKGIYGSNLTKGLKEIDNQLEIRNTDNIVIDSSKTETND